MSATATTNGRRAASAEPGTLPLELITPAADNPRRQVGDVSELAASIAAVGLLEPLVVTPRDGRYLLVCGSRRYAAATQLGLAEVPVVIRELEEHERREAMLIENLQREDLTVLEESTAFQALLDLGFSQRDLAARLGRSQSHLSKRVALLKLPAAARKALDSGGITLEEAHELLRLADMPKRLAKAFGDGRNGSIAHCVRMQLDEHETAEKIGRETERLKRAGVELLKPGRDAYGYPRLPKGAVEISRDGGYDVLKLDPKQHASEPCHAAVVTERYGTVRTLYVCTDRKRHPGLKTQSEGWRGRDTDQAKKEREKQRQQRAAATERAEFIRKLLEDRRAGADGLSRLVAGFLEVSQQDVLLKACGLAGVEPRKSKTSYGVTQRDFRGPLSELAGAGKAQEQRVAMALALAAIEARMENQWTSWGAREREHIDFLVEHGYEISAAERSRLPRSSRRRAAAT